MYSTAYCRSLRLISVLVFIMIVDLLALGQPTLAWSTRISKSGKGIYLSIAKPSDFVLFTIANDINATATPFSTPTLTPTETLSPSPTPDSEVTPTPESTIYRIAGQVLNQASTPVQNVQISLNQGNSTSADFAGEYEFANIPTGSYVITPTLDGYTFLPPTRTVTMPPDAIRVDFVACGGPELAQRYAPLLYFQQDDIYRPIHPSQAMPYVKRIQDKNTNESAYPVTLDLLAQPKWRTNQDAYINLLGNGADDTHNFYNRTLKAHESPLIFARIYCDDGLTSRNLPGKTAIQYWMFYYYDDWTNNHEGDWEMAQIVLDENDEPLYAAYSQHLPTPLVFEGGSKRPWRYVEAATNHRPKVYIANGSHASFFKPYTYDYTTGDDITTPLSADSPVDPTLAMLPVAPGKDTWVYFQGRWGDESLLPCGISGACGAPGPYPRGRDWNYQWDDPLRWAESVPWDEDADQNSDKLKISVRSPFDIELEDLETGHKVNDQLNQIPSAEYIDNAFSNRRTIIVHELSHLTNLTNIRYIVHASRRTSTMQAFTLGELIDTSLLTEADIIEISLPDPQAGKILHLNFMLPASWNTASQAIFSPSSTAGRNLQVDVDGNGVIDQQVAPTIEEESQDFVPPTAITDLHLVALPNNTLALEWTATGDDALNGTATAYDIRYATQPVTISNWKDASVITQTIMPAIVGTVQRVTIPTLPTQGRAYYAMKVADDKLQTSGLSNIVGAINYPLNNQGGKYTLLSLSFSSSTILNAATLATHIGNVGALLKWNPATQSFRFFAPPSSGDNFPVVLGDAVFVSINAGGPSSVTFVGNVTAIQHTLRPGGYNFLSLPHQHADLANAAALAANIGDIQALLAWNAATQSFRFFAPPNVGDNFALRPGDPFIVLLPASGPVAWP